MRVDGCLHVTGEVLVHDGVGIVGEKGYAFLDRAAGYSNRAYDCDGVCVLFDDDLASSTDVRQQGHEILRYF